MIKEIKKSVVSKLLPQRDEFSHKGQNGRVMIIGGSEAYHGAPILAAYGALYSGADLVYLYVPECHYEVTKSMCPDFIVKHFEGDCFNPSHSEVRDIIEFGKTMDSVLFGPGLCKGDHVLDGIINIVNDLHIPTVLDAYATYALKKIGKYPLAQPIVVTPHGNEFKHLVDRDIEVDDVNNPKSLVLLRSIAMDLHVNVLLKGRVDYVASDEGFLEKNVTGNAGMTVGGSGDVLAGAVAGLMAQGCEGYAAARCAAFYMGKAGELLKKKIGYNFIASDLYKTLAEIMHK